MLRASGFSDVNVVLKEESKEFIAQWLPGSACEQYVVSANITATKPGGKPRVRKAAAAKPAAAICKPKPKSAAAAGC